MQHLVKTWLNVVAAHIDYQYCCEAAKIGLASGNELVSFPCPKCGAVCCDPVEQARKLWAQHGFFVCRYKYLLVQRNPFAILGYQLRDFILFVSTFPVHNSTLGVTYHHSRCF